MCGWAIQLKLVTEELRRRGHTCEVLKINEGRRIKNPEYIDVQGGFDYFQKVWRYALSSYQLNVHVNGMSRKGYWLALTAALAGRLTGRPALITFHGGLSQKYFPIHHGSPVHWAFYFLFRLAGGIACDSIVIQREIEKYGIPPGKIQAIATFSSQYVDFSPASLPAEAESFLSTHDPVIFSYVSFRPEYRLEIMRDAMRRYRDNHPRAGFIWLGFPGRELPAAENFVRDWPAEERSSLLLLGNLTHDQFLTLLSRSYINLRTPACDGVAASVLESLALRIPVVASENHRRPDGVITYEDTDPAGMCAKLEYVTAHYEQVRRGLQAEAVDDNIGLMADWLTGQVQSQRTPAPAVVS
jgi:glycosyltransferase involved in cell wall biosynthesis